MPCALPSREIDSETCPALSTPGPADPSARRVQMVEDFLRSNIAYMSNSLQMPGSGVDGQGQTAGNALVPASRTGGGGGAAGANAQPFYAFIQSRRGDNFAGTVPADGPPLGEGAGPARQWRTAGGGSAAAAPASSSTSVPNVLEVESNVAVGSARQINGILGMDEPGVPADRATRARVALNEARDESQQKNLVMTAEMTRLMFSSGGLGS